MHHTRATQSMRVTTDGKNLVSHAGTALLSELADRSGLTESCRWPCRRAGSTGTPTIRASS